MSKRQVFKDVDGRIVADLQARLDTANVNVVELKAAQQRWQASYASAVKRISQLEEALRECADDLESEVEARYAPLHPAMEHRYRRDMEPVRKARALLGVCYD